MPSEYAQVRRAIKALAKKVDEMPDERVDNSSDKEFEMTGQNIGNALW